MSDKKTNKQQYARVMVIQTLVANMSLNVNEIVSDDSITFIFTGHTVRLLDTSDI